MTKISSKDIEMFLKGFFKKLEFYQKAGPVIDRWMREECRIMLRQYLPAVVVKPATNKPLCPLPDPLKLPNFK